MGTRNKFELERKGLYRLYNFSASRAGDPEIMDQLKERMASDIGYDAQISLGVAENHEGRLIMRCLISEDRVTDMDALLEEFSAEIN